MDLGAGQPDLASSTASAGRCPCAGRAPDRIAWLFDGPWPTAATPDTGLTERLPADNLTASTARPALSSAPTKPASGHKRTMKESPPALRASAHAAGSITRLTATPPGRKSTVPRPRRADTPYRDATRPTLWRRQSPRRCAPPHSPNPPPVASPKSRPPTRSRAKAAARGANPRRTSFSRRRGQPANTRGGGGSRTPPASLPTRPTATYPTRIAFHVRFLNGPSVDPTRISSPSSPGHRRHRPTLPNRHYCRPSTSTVSVNHSSLRT